MTEKKPTGLTRIINATLYSWEGLKAAWTHEAAFRQEVLGATVFVPLGLFLGENGIERALLVSSVMGVVVTELLNSAVEALVDRVGFEIHPLSKRAKDLGSAAVFVSITIATITWALILF